MNSQEGIMELDMDKGQMNRMSRDFSGNSTPHPKKPAKPRKQKPSEVYGFNIGPHKTYKTNNICESPSALFKFFTRAVKENNPDAKVPSFERIGLDMNAAQEILQLLQDNKCLNEDTLSAWVMWYVNGLPKNHSCRKFVHIIDMRETWNRFLRFRPKPNNAPPPPVVKAASPGWIADKMDAIFLDGFSKEKVVRACKLFGIVLTAQYMLRVLGAKQVAEALLSSSLKELCSDKDAIRSIYGASCLYSVGKAADGSVFMSDWKVNYEEIWKAASCVQRQPDYERETFVAEFFRRIEKHGK